MATLPFWLRILLAVVVLGAVGLLAGVAASAVGASVPAAAAVAAGAAAISQVASPFAIGRVFSTRSRSQDALRIPYLSLPRDVSSAPNLLLRPAFAAAPFRHRQSELSTLSTWCDSTPTGRVLSVSGPIGSGKTRLASQLCSRLEKRGWTAGFLRSDTSQELIRELAERDHDLLIVVDSAEGRGNEILQLLNWLLASDRRKLWRLLVVRRTHGDWLDVSADGAQDPRVEALAASTSSLDLAPAEPTELDRKAAFKDAVTAFGTVLGRSPIGLKSPDLSAEWFGRPLFIQMAALAALFETLDAGTSGRDSLITEAILVDDALQRERRFWLETAKVARLDIDERIASRAVTVASLTQASDENEAELALRALPDLEPEAAGPVRRRVASWLRHLYPGDPSQWFKPLEPRLLGDANLAAVLGDLPSLASDLLRSSNVSRATQILRVMTRAAWSYPTIQASIKDSVSSDLDRLWPIAIQVAVQIGDPMGMVLAAVLTENRRIDLAAGLLADMPESSVVLRGVSLVAAELLLAVARDGTAQDVANALMTVSARLSAVGRSEDALEAINETIDIYRNLAAQFPAPPSFRLAAALGDRAIYLTELGQLEEADAPSLESIVIFRELAALQPDAYRVHLANGLNNRSNYLANLRQHDEALGASTEAVAILRDLPESRPDGLRPDIAGALLNLSSRLASCGHYEDALEAIEEAVTTYRVLAATEPDAYRHDLAGSLNNRCNRLADLGRPRDAVAASADAIAIYRELAESRPDRFRPNLALALNNHSQRLHELGLPDPSWSRISSAINQAIGSSWPQGVRPTLTTDAAPPRRSGLDEAAVASSREAVTIYRDLAAARPDAFRAHLADSLVVLSQPLAELGRTREVLAASVEAIELYRQLAEERPQVFRRELANALNSLSNHLAQVGRNDAAFAASKEAVGILRSLADTDPEVIRPSLAVALNTLSNRETHLGRHDAALATIEEAMRLFRALEVAEPRAFRPRLAQVMRNYANRLDKVGRSDEADDVRIQANALDG